MFLINAYYFQNSTDHIEVIIKGPPFQYDVSFVTYAVISIEVNNLYGG